MRQQNTKPTVLLDVVPERRTERYSPRFRPGGFTDCSAMSAHHNITEKGNGENLTLKERKNKVKTREKRK